VARKLILSFLAPTCNPVLTQQTIQSCEGVTLLPGVMLQQSFNYR